MPTAVQQIVRKLRVQSLAVETDRQLLEAFADQGDESAFAELVRRHGPLVLGVARRVVGNVQDAEDVFQATFLVLARKASSVPWRDSIKNWLHGVAFRIAVKARSRALKRRMREAAASQQLPVPTPPAECWAELRGVLDEEIARLPARFRDVLILCYLEGKTRDEAAETLGWSLGKVKGCLERGRDRLRERLRQRGLALAAALGAGLLSEATVEAAVVPGPLATATSHAAVAFASGSACPAGLASSVIPLAQGALNAMLIAKIKTFAMVTLFLAFSATAFWGAYHTNAEGGIDLAPIARGLDLVPVAFAQEREGKKEEGKRPDFLGIVRAIDLKVGTLSVTSLRDGEGGADSTFSLASKDLKVSTNFDQPLKLADITPGTRVQLQLKDMDVLSIRVEHPTVPGFLTRIDAEKRTIEARAERKIAHYDVAADARITVNGRVVTLAQAPLEERAFLTLSLDRKKVLAMNFNNRGARDGERPKEGGDRPKEGGDRPGERRPIARPETVDSTILEIDAAKGSLNMLVGRGEDLAIQSIAVPKDIKVKVMFGERVLQEAPLGQLTKPLQASVQWSEDKKSVVAVTVQAPAIRGAIKSVADDAKSITIVASNREEKTIAVDPEVSLRGAGRDAVKLADLRAGTQVMLALSLDRQRVVAITVVPAVRRDGER